MTIKFLTINIWHGGIVWDKLVKFIHQEKPDILCLQEVYDGHKSSLEKRFRTIEEFRVEFGPDLPYDTFGATVIDTSVNIPWGNAIFSKFPIESSRTIFFDLPLSEYNFQEDKNARNVSQGMQEAEIEIEGKKVCVYSWHGVWNNHGQDTKERFIMQENICKAIKGKSTVILAGDTNMNPDTKAISNIQKELNFVSLFENSLQSTFNLQRKNPPHLYADAAVDMIFVSKDIKVLEKEMPKVDVSDHYPLMAMLEI